MESFRLRMTSAWVDKLLDMSLTADAHIWLHVPLALRMTTYLDGIGFGCGLGVVNHTGGGRGDGFAGGHRGRGSMLLGFGEHGDGFGGGYGNSSGGNLSNFRRAMNALEEEERRANITRAEG